MPDDTRVSYVTLTRRTSYEMQLKIKGNAAFFREFQKTLKNLSCSKKNPGKLEIQFVKSLMQLGNF